MTVGLMTAIFHRFGWLLQKL